MLCLTDGKGIASTVTESSLTNFHRHHIPPVAKCSTEYDDADVVRSAAATGLATRQVLHKLYLDQLSSLVVSVNTDLANQICQEHLKSMKPMNHDHLGGFRSISGSQPTDVGSSSGSVPVQVSQAPQPPARSSSASKLSVATYNGNSWNSLRRFLRTSKERPKLP